MTPREKAALIILSLVLSVTGIWILIWHFGWWMGLGVFVLQWGSNVGRSATKKVQAGDGS